ncbi:MAG: phytanoyl-CoA dioxygenase family protein [Candidatus Hydrogenedentes bacterium]|nr:phytanoyl-CoA dioxygenase family protein [Candidatus Hydrogenedentota bacterium]
MDIKVLATQYAEDGVVKVEGLFASTEIETIRAALDRYATEVVPGLPSNDVVMEADGVSVRNCWRMEAHDPFFADLAKKESILSMVATFVKGEPVLMAVESFNKPARIGSAVPPHQDNAYFCLAPSDVLTVWIAVDAVTEANGPVSYLRGTHVGGSRPHAVSGVAGNSMGLVECPDQGDAWVGLLEPGDALVHHAEVIHFSAPNTSDQSRRGLLMVFRGAHCEVDATLRNEYAMGA